MPSDPLPEWVLTRRREIGQEQLAERVDLDRKTVNRIEQGTYGTSVDHLIRIAHALDVPLADLVR